MGGPLYRLARRAYRGLHRGARDFLARLGWNVALSRDFYSPLPVVAELERRRERWDRPSGLVGVSYDLLAMKERLVALEESWGEEYASLPSYTEHQRLDIGPGFTILDARVLYSTLRQLKPRRYVEVGSGFSTYYSWLAVERNRADGHPCEFTVVDPFPRDRLRQLRGVEVIASEVQDVGFERFADLDDGDVLFIDSTHILKLDGDVAYLYLEVIPRLRPGVVIHSHDVHFPYNVPHPAETYVLEAKWPKVWTEAMLIQAFLAFNDRFEILLSAPLLRHFDEDFLRRTVPDYQPIDPADHDTHFGSLWWRRRPDREG